MADDSEEKPSVTHDISSTKASIFDTLNKLRKWREEQIAECRQKQLIESERSLQLMRGNQKQFEQLLDNGTKHQHSDTEDKPKEIVPEISDVSSISLPNDLDNCETLQESSITGHLQRCFNDSTQSNISVSGNKVQCAPEKVPVFSELRNPQFSETNLEEKSTLTAKTDKAKPKRTFLRKGSGLLRYMPKSARKDEINSNKESSKVIKPQLPQRTLNLKPALRKTDVPSEQAKHIRFDIIDSKEDEDIETLTNDHLPYISKADENASDSNIYVRNRVEPFNSAACASENDKLDISNSESESLSLSKESKELKEFEKLEYYVQNNSFSSDSSVFQRIISQGEPNTPPSTNENYSRPASQNATSSKNEVRARPPENFNFPEKIILNKCDEEIQARKRMLQEVISGIDPRIESLQREISCDKKRTLDDNDISERCSTPVNLDDRIPSPECDSNIGSSVFETSPKTQLDPFANEAASSIDCSCCNVKNACKNFYSAQDGAHICNDKEGCACDYPDETYENEKDLDEKSKFRDKVSQLQNEIETYQRLNAKLSSLCKDRENVIRKLQKEREDFNKYKEAEMQKLEAHIQEERRQIKRQKDTFTRYQKLRKDNPTKKERDELSSLRLEVEKLHEDLKRQKIKYNNDSRRWKNRLDIAEKDRDNFKMENIRLEEQCEDLLSTLKDRMKKNLKSLDDACKQPENVKEKKDAESQTEEKYLNFKDFQDSNPPHINSTNKRETTPKVHFNSVSEFEKNNVDVVDKDLEVGAGDSSKNGHFHPEENDLMRKTGDNRKENVEKTFENVHLSVISVSSEAEFREINHGNARERIHLSGEREIIYNSGTRKVISADGKSRKFFFYNGDIKEISSDGQEIYTYVNGIIETIFPDGLKITEFPNGQIQRHYPNGQKEVRFADGTVHNILTDGSEEIRTADGNVVKNCSDGSKIIIFANGQREIVTSTYKRREYPDGAVKIVYYSGRQETRYSDGRIKIKDKEGKILFDTKYLNAPKG